MRTVDEILKNLKETNPEALADKQKPNDEIDLSKVDGRTPPSEIKRLSEAIARRRLTAPGLTKEELASVMRQIGRK